MYIYNINIYSCEEDESVELHGEDDIVFSQDSEHNLNGAWIKNCTLYTMYIVYNIYSVLYILYTFYIL